VAKVLIPALEVMDGNFSYQYLGGKRWKEVPEKLKLTEPGAKISLNPYPHPYP
jgi:hypothetical protein